VNAEAGNADRIELCSALSLGGLTPSIGLQRAVKEACKLPIMSMLRPRAGGFYYSDDEFKCIMYDAYAIIGVGTEGLVFGFLNQDSTVDAVRTKKLVDLAHNNGLEAVFHRAVDITPDIDVAVELLIDLGVDRILTSGGQANAGAGIETIRHLQDAYGDRLQILAGSGVTLKNAHEILDKTGIHQLHSTAKHDVQDVAFASDFIDYSELPNKKGVRNEASLDVIRDLRA
jgi:copper homeostasis protein